MIILYQTAPTSRSGKDSDLQPIKGGTLMDIEEEEEAKVGFEHFCREFYSGPVLLSLSLAFLI